MEYVVSLQEIKTQRQKLTREMAMVDGYDGYFSYSKTKQGYSGVAVYVKSPLRPISVDERIITNDLTPDFIATLKTDPQLLDMEGRSLIMDFGLFVLFNIYFPNVGGDEGRMDFKMDYHHSVRERIDRLLADGRQVVLVGDINAVHEEIDHCDPKQSLKDWGITDFKDLPHRRWLDQVLVPKGPLLDTGRHSHPDRKGMFTCKYTHYNRRKDECLVSLLLLHRLEYQDQCKASTI
jgi:AP endonuclease-2